MAPVQRDDPYGGYNFEITVTGISTDTKAVSGSFTEVSGLEVTVDPIEYRNGSEEMTPRKVQGLKKFTNLTLKKGISGHVEFWNWILAGMNGLVQRADGSIILLNEDKVEVMRWNFKRGWPCKYTGPGLNAANNEIAVETLEICHEGLEVDLG